MNHEIQVNIRYGSLISVGLPQVKMYAKFEPSNPCSYWETDLSAETEHCLLIAMNHVIQVEIRYGSQTAVLPLL